MHLRDSKVAVLQRWMGDPEADAWPKELAFSKIEIATLKTAMAICERAYPLVETEDDYPTALHQAANALFEVVGEYT